MHVATAFNVPYDYCDGFDIDIVVMLVSGDAFISSIHIQTLMELAGRYVITVMENRINVENT